MSKIESDFITELNKVMPRECKDWWQNDPKELPTIARNIIEHLKKENEMLWGMIDNVQSALNVSKYYTNK